MLIYKRVLIVVSGSLWKFIVFKYVNSVVSKKIDSFKLYVKLK